MTEISRLGAGASAPGTMAFIPRYVLEATDITTAEKLLLAAVMTLPYGLFQHVSDFVQSLGMSKSHGCRVMRQLRSKGWLFEDCSMRGRSVIRVNLAKAQKAKEIFDERVATDPHQANLLSQFSMKTQSPLPIIPKTAANGSADEVFGEEVPAQMAVGQTFAPAVGTVWENCEEFSPVSPVAQGSVSPRAQLVPPAAQAVSPAPQSVPPAAPIYIQSKYNKNSNLYSNGRSPIARTGAPAAQQVKTQNLTQSFNDSYAGAMQAHAQEHVPSFTVLEEIDLSFAGTNRQAVQASQAQPQPQAQARALPQVEKAPAPKTAIEFQDVLAAVEAVNAKMSFTDALHTSTASMAGEIFAHYTAGGRNWCVGKQRITIQGLSQLCERYVERAVALASAKSEVIGKKHPTQTRKTAFKAQRTPAKATPQPKPQAAAFGAPDAVLDKLFKPAAGYVERPAGSYQPPAPGQDSAGEKLFGSNAAVFAALHFTAAELEQAPWRQKTAL